MKNEMMPQGTHASIADWLCYFEQNRLQRRSIAWERGVQVEESLRRPVIRSLQRFQVGEQGDGKHLREAAVLQGSQYSEAISLFVQEEQEHSWMLAGIIHALNGNLLRFHWSDFCFVLLRRLSGLRVELFTLLVAEIIAQVYYRVLHDGCEDEVFRNVCAQILHDEDGHVAFHCDYLHTDLNTFAPWIHVLIDVVWHVFFALVCLVVMWDHRSLLRALQVSPVAFWEECQDMLDRARLRIFGVREQEREVRIFG